MVSSEEMQTASINRSIRTIKAELEFLTDAAIITPQTLSDLLSRIPEQTPLRAPLSVGAVPSSPANAGTLQQPPTAPLAAMALQNNRQPTPQQQQPVQPRNDEKNSNGYYEPPQNSAAPPPAYGATAPPQPSWPPLCQATALYAYSSADKGDLELQPNDQISVTEYMNAEWWKGRSARTNLEGIFPRSYVRVHDAPPPPQQQQGSNYGNMPQDVAQGHNGEPSKVEQQGKKFGKKLGNAAIFGAGATIGSNIVNSIF